VTGIPETLESAKAIGKKDGVVVDVKKGAAKPGSGGSCGHSPACLLIVPVVLYEAAFPDHYVDVTIVENGAVRVRAVYDDDGSFVSAAVFRDGEAHHVSVLELACLERRIAVETSHATIDASGKEGDPSPTRIESQASLLKDYAAKVAAAGADGGGACAVEAIRVLGIDAVDLAKRTVADKSAGVSQAVLDAACSESAPLLDESSRAELANAAALRPESQPGVAALACFLRGGKLDPAASGVVRTIAAGLAKADARSQEQVLDAIQSFVIGSTIWKSQERDDRRAAIAPVFQTALADVADPLTRDAIRLAVGVPIDERAHRDLIDKGGDGYATFAIGAIDAGTAEGRAVAYAELREPTRRARDLLASLENSDAPPTADERSILVARAITPGDSSLVEDRARVAALLAPVGDGLSDGDRHALREGSAHAQPGSDADSLSALRLAAGEVALTTEVLARLVPSRCAPSARPAASSEASRGPCPEGKYSFSPRQDAPAPYGDLDQLAFFALGQTECGGDDLYAAAQRIAAGESAITLSCARRRDRRAD
jgi:hypothetical protein